MSDYMGPELVQAFAERPLDHQRDLRPDSLAMVGRVLSLTDQELANLRGDWCSDCGSRECDETTCDRCGKHGGQLVEIPNPDPCKMPRVRTVCQHCSRLRECASCSTVAPRYMLVDCGEDIFCAACCRRDPIDAEGW